MVIYNDTLENFAEDVTLNRISEKLYNSLREHHLSGGAEGEVNAWNNSLHFMKDVLDTLQVSVPVSLSYCYATHEIVSRFGRRTLVLLHFLVSLVNTLLLPTARELLANFRLSPKFLTLLVSLDVLGSPFLYALPHLAPSERFHPSACQIPSSPLSGQRHLLNNVHFALRPSPV